MRDAIALRRTATCWLLLLTHVGWLSTGACSSDGSSQQAITQPSAGTAATTAPASSAAGAGQVPSSSTTAAPRPGMSAIQAGTGASMTGSAGRSPSVPVPSGVASAPSSAAGGSTASAGMSAAAGSMSMAMAGASGSAGMPPGAAGNAAMPMDGDLTSVCKGGKVGMDSDMAKVMGLNVSREFGAVKYLSNGSNPILSFKMMLQVPKVPTAKQTLFIWPGLQCRGASDPGRIGNGILQPVLTWGSSCAPKAPKDVYANWWMSAMYVNVSSSAAGPSGCAGGDYMDTQVGDQLFIDMSVKDDKWVQTVVNMRTMKKVDLTSDLKGQVQNWATWAVEVPSGESIKPVEDTIFTQSVLTFTNPVTTCQPNQAGGSDYYSAPVLSADGLHCCYDKVILRADRGAGR